MIKKDRWFRNTYREVRRRKVGLIMKAVLAAGQRFSPVNNISVPECYSSIDAL
jgi:hypothetical protein